jgi:predicted  nucleic acid-binding Zn-ribbon protein
MEQAMKQAREPADGLEEELAAARQETAVLRTERDELKTAHEQVRKTAECAHEHMSS